MILVVGGAGYIGSHTNKILNKQGYDTVVFDNLSLGHREFVKWGECFEGDLANIKDLRRCFKQYDIKAVMHFSAFSQVGESVLHPDKYYQNNVVNTLNLLNVMREFSVKYFILSSTAATFGNPIEIPITESHPQKPINPYGRTKLMIEEILKDYDDAYGIKSVCLRYFNAAGADPDGEIGERHDPETHIIPLIIYAALGKRDDIKIFGTDYETEDGTCIRDYIHINDLATAHIKALEYLQKENISNWFNLGNGSGQSVKQVIEMVKKVSGRNFTVIEAPRREGDPATLIAASKKAMDTLNWQPLFANIETIVQTAWDWHANNN